jgi:hypothetical protein
MIQGIFIPDSAPDLAIRGIRKKAIPIRTKTIPIK